MSNNDLSVFSFRNNSGTAQYSMNNGSTWVNFKNPTGTRSITTNGTYDVTNYASASVNVPSQSGYMSTLTTLWTNPNPTSSWSNSVVSWSGYSLDSYTSSRYYLRITTRYSTSDDREMSYMIAVSEFNKTSSATKSFNWMVGHFGLNSVGQARRIFRESSNSIRIGNCMEVGSGTTTANNGSSIPIKLELCAIYPS